MAMLFGHRLRVPTRQASSRTRLLTVCGVGRKFYPVVRAFQLSDDHKRIDSQRDFDVALSSTAPSWQRVLGVAAAGIFAWSITLPALAGVDAPDTTIIGPSADTLLGAGPDFSFTTLLIFTLLGYWLVKALTYLGQNTPDGSDGSQDDKHEQRPGSGGGANDSLTDIGHAHIRSYVDPSQPGRGGESGAKELRNASLARSAAYRVTATLKESQPRIHALVEELTAQQTQWPLRPPRNAEVDFVAALVYSRVVQERSNKGPEYVLGPRELAALETRLLEEVAEKVAADQVADFVKMAAKGTLHPKRPGSDGADHHPHSHAH
ncbi:hypothetical protein VOLCADRAFT_120348 [Volvox carteri f. nagariensis]|uniref:Uncharacterized protein n=1 Tax=Volvox carteri f. nagariensis TaxID=3068 RepID=D8TKR6_VOLCA|nr:uncharacterized protein VOLCADRAFT_120348 [Volvox carteri f. nagariensis]EFJ51933.1 hypothetical protein VOLCADRAFT_120348 [Volvox carteri f. nagariensis]|eukprot:XP_002946707.1 hypothetical protein VOLCADRAFT_120348 [Volvox carteri f. nagariensis]